VVGAQRTVSYCASATTNVGYSDGVEQSHFVYPMRSLFREMILSQVHKSADQRSHALFHTRTQLFGRSIDSVARHEIDFMSVIMKK